MAAAAGDLSNLTFRAQANIAKSGLTFPRDGPPAALKNALGTIGLAVPIGAITAFGSGDKTCPVRRGAIRLGWIPFNRRRARIIGNYIRPYFFQPTILAFNLAAISDPRAQLLEIYHTERPTTRQAAHGVALLLRTHNLIKIPLILT
jgi:hypothetical protein